VKELDQIKNVNITIKCKNQADFYFKGKIEEGIKNNNSTDSIPLSDINQKSDTQNDPPGYTAPVKKKDSGITKNRYVAVRNASNSFGYTVVSFVNGQDP